MKTLLVMRHAKSSWDNPELADFDRPLNKRGEEAAPLMGNIIRERDLVPDIIISSPAKRAKDTANLVKTTGKMRAAAQFDERIYEASPFALMCVVSEIDETVEVAMLIGHNPGIEGFIKVLTGEPEQMSTAAVAMLKLDIDIWKDVSVNCGSLEFLIRPKHYLV